MLRKLVCRVLVSQITPATVQQSTVAASPVAAARTLYRMQSSCRPFPNLSRQLPQVQSLHCWSAGTAGLRPAQAGRGTSSLVTARPSHMADKLHHSAGRHTLPRVQAAAGGGAGSGSGGSKGYSSGDNSGSDSGGGGLWASYNKLLEQYPLLIKAITTALLSAVGNLICQLMVEGKSELDWRRFNTFTALGFVWVAPCLHFWFGTLNRLVTNPGNTGALMRMALDQLGFAPLFISSMIAILAGLDGKSVQQCVDVVKRDLPDAIRANWALWVPAQFINFRYVPASYQVLFANMVALLWNVYFSFATRPKTA